MRAVSLLLLLLVGCATAVPGPAGGQESAAYQSDLIACTASAAKSADAEVKRRFYTFVSYPISYPLQRAQDLAACMSAHGYATSG